MTQPNVQDIASPPAATEQSCGGTDEALVSRELVMHNASRAVDTDAKGFHNRASLVFSVDEHLVMVANSSKATGGPVDVGCGSTQDKEVVDVDSEYGKPSANPRSHVTLSKLLSGCSTKRLVGPKDHAFLAEVRGP